MAATTKSRQYPTAYKLKAIKRAEGGEVPAAVVLASREVANLFPEVEGFRTFRVPLKTGL